jgi:hypothetical protein
MRNWTKAAMLGAALALAGCGGGGDDQAAENVEAAAENQAENFEAAADNATNDTVEEQLEENASAAREAGEEKADEIDDSDGANASVESNVSGM